MGFIGTNLGTALRWQPGIKLIGYDVGTDPEVLARGLREADVIFHLAGVNRPERVEEYEWGNTDFTAELCGQIRMLGRAPKVVFSSSIQADLDNPYGRSKRKAEEQLQRFADQTDSLVVIFRLKNVFGKWCRPNYNSVVATFCNNIAHCLPISISDPAKRLDLVYVDDVCAAMMESAGLPPLSPDHLAWNGYGYAEVKPHFTVTLGELAEAIKEFKDSRTSLRLPALGDPFIIRLYATYLSYVEDKDFAYRLDQKVDNRGSLAEFLKSSSLGQVFVSHTKPGITRGNHYHNTKTEKFLIVHGHAIIRFRHILEERIIEYRVSGEEYKVVDIPPGYTHSIENIGQDDLVTFFWAAQIFDPESPDTFYEEVIK